MRNKALAAGVAGLLAFGGVAAVATPIASAQTDDEPSVQQEHHGEARGERLEQLVTEGIITQEQADRITARFEERAAMHSERRAERAAMIADLLGITTDELTSALQGGQTLAEVAEANGVGAQSLINDLVIAANARLDGKVADGSIDAARADEIRAGLVDRITARVNGERPSFGERHGRFAAGRFGGPGPQDAPARFAAALEGLGEA